MEMQVLEPLGCAGMRRKMGPSLVQTIVAHIYDIPAGELSSSTRGCHRVALARQVAMYLMNVVYGLSTNEVADVFGRDRSTVSHACHHVEDLRDGAMFDRHLAQLEHLLREAARIEAGR